MSLLLCLLYNSWIKLPAQRRRTLWFIKHLILSSYFLHQLFRTLQLNLSLAFLTFLTFLINNFLFLFRTLRCTPFLFRVWSQPNFFIILFKSLRRKWIRFSVLLYRFYFRTVLLECRSLTIRCLPLFLRCLPWVCDLLYKTHIHAF